MLRPAFQTGGQTQDVCLNLPCCRNDRRQRGLACRQRTGLVDNQGVDTCESFKRLGIADQYTGARASPGRGHDRHRCGEPKRAGAGDDQHRHGDDHRIGERRFRAEGCPDDKGGYRAEHHGGHKNAGHPVSDFLYRRTTALGGGNHIDNP